MRGRSHYQVSRKLLLMLVLSAIGLWRGVGLMERMLEATPGGTLVEAGAGERLLRDEQLDLSGMRGERGPAQLRNGFSLNGSGSKGPAKGTPASNGPGDGSASPLGTLMGLLGGEGTGEEEVAEEEKPPPPKPTSIVRVRTKGDR